jgi:hypothetical protein
MILSQRDVNHPLPSILYTQLLGLSMGVDKKALGLDLNEISINGVEALLAKESELTQEKEFSIKKENKRETEFTKD